LDERGFLEMQYLAVSIFVDPLTLSGTEIPTDKITSGFSL